MTLDSLRMLGANIRVAANLRHAEDAEAAGLAADLRWRELVMRAAKLECHLWRCPFGPNCDGSCGCGPSLFDRYMVRVDDDKSDPDFDLLITRLEANGGVKT